MKRGLLWAVLVPGVLWFSAPVNAVENSATSQSQSTVATTETTTSTLESSTSESQESLENQSVKSQIEAVTFYYTVKANQQVWLDEAQSQLSQQDLSQQTLQLLKKITKANGQVLYQAINQRQESYYLTVADQDLVSGAMGTGQKISQYFVFQNSQSPLWLDQNGQSISAANYLKRTFFSKERYRHFNGQEFYSIYDNKNQFLGYAPLTSIKNTGAQGSYYNLKKYVEVKNNNDRFWQNFTGTIKGQTKNLKDQTLYAKGIYYHFNGTKFLSISQTVNGKEVWRGYLNENSANYLKTAFGNYKTVNRYGTFISGNYQRYSDYYWKKRGSTQSLKGKTYHIRGKYNHYNGASYYSVYDNQNKWQGYVNAGAVKLANGRQGIWQKFGKTVVLKNNKQPLWSNFNWQKRNQANQLQNKLFTVRGYYQHFNGARYYSIHDSKGKWYGYINVCGANLASSSKAKLSKVQTLLNKKYKKSNLGIYVLSLKDGEIAQINQNKVYHAASTGKLPVLYYTQKMINEGKINPNTKLTYTDQINRMSLSYMRGGAGILQNRSFGSKYSIDTIMNWTCKYSDNQGANFLGYYAAGKYNNTMKKEVSRIVGRNWQQFSIINARENALLMQAIYNQGGRLTNYLSNTTYDNQRIPKYLPVRVAHKIGDLWGYAHDCGIVYTKEPYVICVMTQNAGYEIISQISRDVYNIMK